jgi:hypothetical protein
VALLLLRLGSNVLLVTEAVSVMVLLWGAMIVTAAVVVLVLPW